MTSAARVERHVRETPFLNLNDCTTSVPNEQGWAVHLDAGHHRRLREGGTTAVVHCLPSEVREDFRGGMRKLGRFHRQLERHPGCYHVVERVSDLLEGPPGSIGIVLGFLTPAPIEDDLETLGLFQRLGVRTMHLAYNRANLLGGGISERRDGGLTRFGERAVREMNRLGILIDLTHSGPRTALDALAASEAPAVYTHTACAALNDHIRNVSDEQIEAVAAAGGYVGII
jgi:membrane dipeptidase